MQIKHRIVWDTRIDQNCADGLITQAQLSEEYAEARATYLG